VSEYTEVEQPFCSMCRAGLGWETIGQGLNIPVDPGKSLRLNFR